MTLDEFRNEFDIMYNNIMSNQAPGLDDYEMSVFLTTAEYEIIKNRLTSKPGGNKYQEGFDDSSKRDTDFYKLIRQGSYIISITDSIYGTAPEAILDRKLSNINLKEEDSIENALIVTSERIFLYNTVEDKSIAKSYQVYPARYSDLTLKLSKPFGRPHKHQSWRIIEGISKSNEFNSTDSPYRFILHDDDYEYIHHTNTQIVNNKLIAGKHAIYYVTYIKKPRPIILSDLSNGLSIDGYSTKSECELDEELHREIIQRAVEIAKVSFLGDPNLIIQTGMRNE